MEVNYLSFIIIITLFLIGFIVSYLSGMVGIGGSIIKYPMLLYIPPLVGLAAFSAHEVSGLNAIQVLFASISGVWAYRKGSYLNKDLDRKSTRLNSSHVAISYAVFCLK